jgi:hypothetical protein
MVVTRWLELSDSRIEMMLLCPDHVQPDEVIVLAAAVGMDKPVAGSEETPT